jgi:hypothetical protein
MTAKSIAAAVAILFIGSGTYQLFLVTPRPSTLGVALVVSGAAILYGRSWGYYIAYLAAFSCLLPPQRTALIPVASSVRRFLRLYAGMEPELIYALLSFLFAGVLGWSHFRLAQTRQLDRPMSWDTGRQANRVALLVSLALVFFPAINFTYHLIIDPPGPGGPAAPGGGLQAFYALYRSWPFVVAGLIGTAVCLLARRRKNSGDAPRS